MEPTPVLQELLTVATQDVVPDEGACASLVPDTAPPPAHVVLCAERPTRRTG